MNYKDAKEKLSELRDSLNEVLGNNSEELTREDAEQALKTARTGAKQAKKTFLSRVKDFPVVDKITQLGAAGTVAVGTAAITQTNIAVDETEVFVASVANDVVHERLRFPPIINNFVDFSALDLWGREVIKERISEAKEVVAKVESKVSPEIVEEQLDATKETNNQEPQAEEERANDSEENRGDTEEVKQVAEEVKSEEKNNEESDGELASVVPEGESVDEIDEVKPHSEIESDESGRIINPIESVITPDNLPVVSPSIGA